MGECWRANAKLGYSVHTARVWGHNCGDAGFFVTCCSRVVEKSALFTLLVLEDVVQDKGARVPKQRGDTQAVEAQGRQICMCADARCHSDARCAKCRIDKQNCHCHQGEAESGKGNAQSDSQGSTTVLVVF